MRKTIWLAALCVLFAAGCSKKKSSGPRLRSDTDSVAYVIGMNVGRNLIRMDSTLNVDAVCDAIRDVFRGTARMDDEQARLFYLRYMNFTLSEKARAYEEQFLEDIVKQNRSYARTASGVTYTVGDVGDQERVPASDRDTVWVRYAIRTVDGREVFSSYERGDTLRSALGDLSSGMRESLKLVGKGGRIDAWMPARTAFGAEGDAALGIGPNATLFYEMELVDVDKYADRLRRR